MVASQQYSKVVRFPEESFYKSLSKGPSLWGIFLVHFRAAFGTCLNFCEVTYSVFFDLNMDWEILEVMSHNLSCVMVVLNAREHFREVRGYTC